MTQQRSSCCIFIRIFSLNELLSSCVTARSMIRLAVPRLHQFIALLLLVLWTPVVSHCLLEVALGLNESGCCESGSPAQSGHSDCTACLSVEGGLAKTDSAVLPTLDATQEIFQIALSSASEARPILLFIRQTYKTPPVPPATVILQATLAQPVRGPSLVG